MYLRGIDKIFLWMVKVGLWALPILPLYVSSGMLFPFITGKNFAFRVIVELIFIFWAGLAVLREEYRPRLTPLFKAVTAFVAIVFLADIFSLNPYRAFFSNYERMEGFMMLGHLYLYFVMLVSVFRTRRDWLVFFHVTLAASLVVSLVGLLQKFGYRVSLQGGFRVDSTIGNPTYLAAYLMFHIWLFAMLIYQFWRKKWLAALYGAAFIFELLIIYFTATRGAILSFLAVSIFLLLILTVFWRKVLPQAPSFYRILSMSFLLTLVVIPVLFWQMRNTDFVRLNPVLQRLTKYSFQERTIQSRFMIWKMSARAVLERPILGWGQENYYLVFQKYFNPGLYAQEPWFDRSHNIFFDWLVHAGFLGLLSFLFIFAVAFRGLFRSIRHAVLPLWQGIILAAAFLTYFFQNIFVFDNLNTYLLLFAFLAYSQEVGEPAPPRDFSWNRNKVSEGVYLRAYAVMAFLFLAVLVGGYFIHWKPIQESKALVQALQLYQLKAPADQVLAKFKEALSYRSFGDTEVREQTANTARAVLGSAEYKPDEKKRFAEFTVEEMRKEISRPTKDVKHMIFLASILDRAISLNPAYAAESEKTLLEAIQLSPSKQILYFELAQLYIYSANPDKTIEILRKAWELDKNYSDAAANLLLIGVMAEKPEVVAEVKAGLNFKIIRQEDLLKNLANLFIRVGEYEGAARAYERLVEISPQNPMYHASYAAILAKVGKDKEAKDHVEEAARLDPANFKKEAEIFLKTLKPGP